MGFFSKLFGRRAAPVASDGPVQHDVDLGDGLTVHVIDHREPKLDVRLWTYVTRGLAAHGQRELVFSVRRRPNEVDDDEPESVLVLLQKIHAFARDGKLVDAGGTTELGSDVLAPQLRAVVYAEAQSIAGVRLPDRALTAILIDRQELAIVQQFGAFRVLARLGQQHRHFPFPPWTDRDRASVAHREDLEGSFVSQIGATVRLPQVSVVVEEQRVVLQIPRSQADEVVKILAQLPADTPFAILAQPAPTAHAWLVWKPGQTAPEAITGEPPSDRIVAGGFLAIAVGADDEQVLVIEDGFGITLPAATWATCLRAITEGGAFAMAGSEMSFELRWIEHALRSAVDGKVRHADGGWHTHAPAQSTPGAPKRQVTLLSSEKQLAAALPPDQLAGYIKQLYDKIDAVVPPSVPRAKLTIHVELEPGSPPSVQLVLEPTSDLADRLGYALAAVKAPALGGPLVFEVETSLGNDA